MSENPQRSGGVCLETIFTLVLYHKHKLENGMPVALALIIGVAILAALLIGLLWTLVLFVPFSVYVALSIFWMVRRGRRNVDDAAVAREAERQKQLNDQEYRAWRSAVDGPIRNTSKKDRALRQFDAGNPHRK